MGGRSTGAVCIFIGALLIVIFVVGLIVDANPGAFDMKYRYDITVEQFCTFCKNVWLPAGIIGIPLFLASLIVSLVREGKDKKNNNP